MNTKVLIYSGIGVAGAAAGFGAGYIVSKKRHEKIADEEIESVKETYAAAKAAVVEKPDLETIVGPVEVVAVSLDNDGAGSIEVVGELGQEDAPTSDLDPEQEKLREEFDKSRGEGVNVFTKYGDKFDSGDKLVETAVDVPDVPVDADPERLESTLELTKATPEHPYLISIDDFHDGTWDNHSKLNVTWFAEDKILIDEREQIIPDVANTIGEWAIENFGNLSLDPEVVYVRNQALNADFEVTRETASYQEQILGLTS